MAYSVESDLVLAEIVVQALSPLDPGWAATDPSSVEVQNVSGAGTKRGAGTFRVTAQPADGTPVRPSPSAVALHHGPKIDNDGLSMRQTAAATDKLNEVGLSPGRLACGSNWYIEEWWAADENDWTQYLENWTDLGLVCAKMHQISTDWCDPYRTELVQEHFWMADAPVCNVWTLFKCPLPSEVEGLKFLEENPGYRKQYFDLGPFAPTHPLASRVVTSHNDFHHKNVISLGKQGLRIIDLECVGVNIAIHDITSAIAGASSLQSQAFLKGYMQASGHAVTEDDITALLLDSHLYIAYGVRCWLGVSGPLGMSSDEAEERLKRWKEYGASVRVSKAEQDALLEIGSEKSFHRVGLI